MNPNLNDSTNNHQTDSNLGRYEVIKAAFAAHILSGLHGLQPVTPALSGYVQREPMGKLAVCQDRMVDKAEELLAQYQRAGGQAMGAPLPMVLLAFAKDLNSISPDRGQSVSDPVLLAVSDQSTARPYPRHYRARFDHVEARVQLAFIAHESETARAMTSQMRLYINQFTTHRWPLQWRHAGEAFTTTGSLESYEPMDEAVDVAGRTNLTVLVWNLTLNAQLPYLEGDVPVVKQVDVQVVHHITQMQEMTQLHDISRWQPQRGAGC